MQKAFEISGSVGNSAAEVVGSTYVTSGWQHEHVAFNISAATQALQAFSIEMRMHGEGEWTVLNSTWAAAGAIVLFKSGDLAACAAGAEEQAIVKLSAVQAIRFKAQAASATSTVTIKGALA